MTAIGAGNQKSSAKIFSRWPSLQGIRDKIRSRGSRETRRSTGAVVDPLPPKHGPATRHTSRWGIEPAAKCGETFSEADSASTADPGTDQASGLYSW